MELKITCIPGDGIGPEIVAQAKKVLDAVAAKYGHTMRYTDVLMGGASIDVHGVPLTVEIPQPRLGTSWHRTCVRRQGFWESARR